VRQGGSMQRLKKAAADLSPGFAKNKHDPKRYPWIKACAV